MRLNTKVFLTLTAVIAVALVAASLLIGRSAGNAYRVYLRGHQQQQLALWADSAAARYAETRSWTEVQGWLDETSQDLAAGNGMGVPRGGRGPRWQTPPALGPLYVVDAESGAFLAPTPADMRPTGILATAPIVVDGRVIAALAMEPTLMQVDADQALLLNRVNQAILLSALTAGAAALLIGWLLTASILRPLRRLEAGVARIAAGDLAARVGVAGDDEVTQLATNFNYMAESLQAQEALRQRMIADIAHELRTPLSIVQGNLQAILEGVYPLSLDEVRAIHQETRLMERLVTDLHELAQAEAGHLPLFRQRVQVDEVLTQMVAQFRALAAAQAVTLRVQPPANPIAVSADPDRLQQIMTNLLGNALRHTPAGGTITLATAAKEDTVRFTVANNGPAIDPADLPHLFDRFYRGDDSRTRGRPDERRAFDDGGSGLGLAIVAALVEAHQGAVGVESRADETQFWFELPKIEAYS